ncbi:MAG TPA: hypothetical protein VF692_06065 [Pyrinomonadaceae bacterium]
MSRQTRFFISAALVAVFTVSTFILSNSNRVKACPVPVPATLLELYLRSDLIVVADVKDEKDGKIIEDENSYYSVEVGRNLRVASILKGKTAKNFVFTKIEYRNKQENNEVAESEEEGYFPYGYRGLSKITNGERYLFFFTKDAETGRVELSDEISGVKKLNDFELDVHQKRLAELKKIVGTKENQLDALTDWLVSLTEEPSTRWDGVADLTASFRAVEYKKDEQDAEPFVIDEDFTAHTPAIAENLSDSQKNYLSSVYFSSLSNIFDKDDADEFYYSLSNLVSRWDKSRMLTYAYGVLQTVDQTDSAKAGRVMNYISMIAGDETLSEISSRYNESESEDADEEIAEAESTANAEVETEKAGTGNETNAATETLENPETTESSAAIEKIKSADFAQTEPTAKSAPPEKLTRAQKREKALKDFAARYEYLLARNFAVEEPTTEIVQK